MLLPVWSNFSYPGVFFILYIILLLIVIFCRVFTTVHVSLIGQYFEIAPLFAIPFMVLFHLYGPSHWFYAFLIVLLLHVIFIIILNLMRKAMKNAAFRVFDGFLYEDSTVTRLPKFALGNISSFIRLIAYYNSDPAVLLRFLQNQKQTHLRTSAFIEVCRFLSVFPEYRPLMLNEIKNWSSKSSFNQYTLYIFNLFLESSMSIMVPESYINNVDRLYLSYISHFHFYWNARKNGQIFRAFFESFTAAFFHYECKIEIQGLFRIFPFAPLLHKYYGDMLLNIDGKFDEYKKEIFFSTSYEKKPNMFIDPLLHLSSLSNPKILQFCNKDYQSSLNHLSGSASAMNTINISRSESSRFLFPKSFKKENKLKKSRAASKIIRSKLHIPYFHLFNYIFPPLIILVFIIYSAPINSQKMKKKNELKTVIDDVHRSFYSTFAIILAPLVLKHLPDDLPDDQQECQSLLFLMSNVFNQIYSKSPIISYFANAGLIISFHDTNDFAMKSKNICDIVFNFSTYMISSTINNINFIIEQDKVFTMYINDYRKHNQSMFKYVYFILYGSISIVLFLMIYFITACITMNKIMSKNRNAIDFLASDRRLAPILQDFDSREIFWDQLNGFDSSINFSDSSLHMESESEVDPFSTATIQTNSNLSASTSTFNQGSSSARQKRGFIHNQEPNSLSEAGNVEISESGQGERMALNRIPRLTLSHQTFTGSGINVKRQTQRTVQVQSARSNSSENKYNNDSIITNSAIVNDDNLSIDATNNSSNIVNIDLQSNMIDLNAIEENGNPLLRQKSSGSLTCQKEIDINSISGFLAKKKKETCIYGFLSIIIMVLSPWIILYIFTILAYHPLKSYRNEVSKNIENSVIVENDFYASIYLVNETFYQLIHKNANISIYININDYFKSRDSFLSNRYFEQQCFEFETLECFSVSSIVSKLIEQEATESFLANYALPLFLTYSEEGMKELFNIHYNDVMVNHFADASFIALVVLFSIIYIVSGFFSTKSISKGFNSLFHFPSFEASNIQINSKKDRDKDKNVNSNSSKDDGNDNKNKSNINIDLNINVNSNNNNAIVSIEIPKDDDVKIEKIQRFPTNVIIITSVTETDEIYSITDTCLQIINKKSSEMICRKLSKIFPIVKTSNGFEIRDHNGKSFISKSITIGKLSKTALIETSKVEAKNKTTNVLQKLINFMPNYFAKTFSEEFINFFHFDKCILIFIRIEPNAPQIENFFTIINRLDQTFFNIDFIRSNGSVLTCLYRDTDDLEILLFLRDLITSSEESCKKIMKNFALKSVYIDLIGELNINIIEGDIEPEIYFEEKQFLDSEKMTYFVDEHCIGISDEALNEISIISKFAKQVMTLFEKTINVIPFNVFSDEIIKNM